MSGFLTRSKNILRRTRSSSQLDQDKSTPVAHSRNIEVSTSTDSSEIDGLGFIDAASGTDPVVDIVAIHGLDGYRENTWSTDRGIMWLRDLLPSRLAQRPNPRIWI